MARRGITIRFSDEERAAVETVATAEGITFAQAVRKLAEEGRKLHAERARILAGGSQVDPAFLAQVQTGGAIQ